MLCSLLFWLFSALPLLAGNWYRVFFYSKGTGPANVVIEALNDAGAKAQVQARYPGAHVTGFVQISEPK
jgi:hypothetical protein